MNIIHRLFAALKPVRPFESERQAYFRLKKRGLVPDGIIDVGAYEGEWTRMARSVWPDVPVLMVEPQAAKKPMLDRVCRDLSGVRYRPAVLSSRRDQLVTFYEMETGSSLYSENSNADRTTRQFNTSTLDDLSDDFLGSSIFLKIDVQGAELDVLAGGRNTLSRVSAIQLELPIVNYNEGAPTFQQAISVMADIGYTPIELSNQTIIQGVLAQVDLIFAKENNEIRNVAFNFK